MISRLTNHILLSCHEEDYALMDSVLAGMEAHSGFATLNLTESWIYDAETKPAIDLWHGFAGPGFPGKVLSDLLNSADWKNPAAVSVVVQTGPTWTTLSLEGFTRLVSSGYFK